MLLIPAILSTYQSLKDKTLKIVFETNEPTPEQLMYVAKYVQSFGFLAFKENISKEDKELIEGLNVEFDDAKKTKSQRLRNVFYKLFEQNPEGYKDFNLYYEYQMERLINHFKSKIE